MRMSRCVGGAMVVLMGACAAMGQIVPPAPEKTPPTPEYTPPPPPPTPKLTGPNATPEKPAVETPLPTLVERDDAGALKPLAMPAEEAAVRALKPDEETLKKVEASLAGRRDDLDRLVIEQVEALAELRTFAAKVDEKTSLDDITKTAKKALPFKNFQGVLDRLSREGAIEAQMRSRAQKVAQEYQKAADQELMKGFEHSNTQAMVVVGFRRYLATTVTEAHAALDRQLLAAGPRMTELLGAINAPADMKSKAASKLRGLPSGDDAGAKATRLKALQEVFFDVLGPEQRQALLKAASPRLFEAPAAETK